MVYTRDFLSISFVLLLLFLAYGYGGGKVEMKDGRMLVSNCTEVVGSFGLNCHQALLVFAFGRLRMLVLHKILQILFYKVI